MVSLYGLEGLGSKLLGSPLITSAIVPSTLPYQTPLTGLDVSPSAAGICSRTITHQQTEGACD